MEVVVGLIGAAATVGAAKLAMGSGFTGRHETSHREELMETKRNRSEFRENLKSGEVTGEEEAQFWKNMDEFSQRQNEYYESIESYKKTSWLNFLKKSKKRKNVRRAKRLTRRSNNSLRSFNGSMQSGSGASSICASAGSPPGWNLPVGSIYDWTRSVHDASDSEFSNRTYSTELSDYPHETDGYPDHMGETMEYVASGQPPQPSYLLQPNWRGTDGHKAYAINPDPSLYDNAWNRIRQSLLEQGVGMHEAKLWYRRPYGHLGELGQMLPAHIGHAAAYEAYRTWIHNSSKGKEGLIGLAVAEASRLLQISNRGMEDYARVAAEAAAATAAIIFYNSRERDEDGHRSRSPPRHNRDHDRHARFLVMDMTILTRQTLLPIHGTVLALALILDIAHTRPLLDIAHPRRLLDIAHPQCLLAIRP